MKKLLFVFTLFLFACGNDSNSVYIPITQKPKPACTACIGWIENTNGGIGTWIWTSSENPLPNCDISTCDTNKYDCASFTGYSTLPIYDKNQCQ